MNFGLLKTVSLISFKWQYYEPQKHVNLLIFFSEKKKKTNCNLNIQILNWKLQNLNKILYKSIIIMLLFALYTYNSCYADGYEASVASLLNLIFDNLNDQHEVSVAYMSNSVLIFDNLHAKNKT